MQRLFSAFPNGWPGRGLLLQRVVTAAFLFYFLSHHLRDIPSFVLHFIAASAGILLLLGLWTPISGTVIALIELWIAAAYGGCDAVPILLASLGVTLAIIGPGAWSLDALLFGRKHFEIPLR